MEKNPGRPMLNNAADAGVVQARRVIDEMLAVEDVLAQPAEY